jgi:hypothetical protein
MDMLVNETKNGDNVNRNISNGKNYAHTSKTTRLCYKFITAIQESKDLKIMILNALQVSLESHEMRMN